MHIYAFCLAYNANILPGLKCIAFENWKLAWTDSVFDVGLLLHIADALFS